MAVAPDERVAVDEHSKETRHVINRDVDGSTSNALAALLVSHGFKSLPLDSPLAATAGASIYLAAPRDSIPWAQLEDGGALTLVNKIRGHELLTRKSKLARLLRDHSAQPHPQTFVLVPEPLRAPKEGISAIQADKRRALAAEDEKERYLLMLRVRRACLPRIKDELPWRLPHHRYPACCRLSWMHLPPAAARRCSRRTRPAHHAGS